MSVWGILFRSLHIFKSCSGLLQTFEKIYGNTVQEVHELTTTLVKFMCM